MKAKLGDKCLHNYCDTESLIYLRKEIDIYEMMKQDRDRFDTSDYSANNIFGIKQLNIKIPGKIKDESTGDIGCEFFGVRSKVYLYETLKKILAKKIKGINTQVASSVSLPGILLFNCFIPKILCSG